MNLLSTTSIFSFYTLISRVLGYVRDILIAIFLGASIFADAFFVAFRIPNTFRRLFAEGTFNAAFVPSYTSENIKGKNYSQRFADEVFNLLLISLLFIVLLAEIFTPFLVYLIAPGFFSNSEKFNLAIELTRITFPFLLFVSISSFFAGILNSNNKFAAAAAAPIILNLILILALFVAYFFGLNYTKVLSYGVFFSGVIQLLFLVYFSRKYYFPRVKLRYNFTYKVKSFLKKLLPSIFSSGVTQINILIGTIIASFQTGAVSYLYYADRVYQINLAIAGVAVSTVSLPLLSKEIKKGNVFKVKDIQNKSLELSLLLSIPAAAGLVIASYDIVNALFGYGSFEKNDVLKTSEALKYFGYGIPAFALVKVLSNLFFARGNTKTPFYISVIIVFLNVSVSLAFFNKIGFLIIPIATTLSTWIGTFIYFGILAKKKFYETRGNSTANILKIILSTTIMSIFLLIALNYFSSNLDYLNTYKIFYLMFIVIFSAIVYIVTSYLLGILNLKNYRTF